MKPMDHLNTGQRGLYGCWLLVALVAVLVAVLVVMEVIS